jgi:hypothetical protein
MEEMNLALPLPKGAPPSPEVEAEMAAAYRQNLARAMERARMAPDAKGRRRPKDESK